MSATCDDCGRGIALQRVSVLVRSGGDYLILGPCCSFKHAAHKQYQPENPANAVARVQRGTVATDGGNHE